MAIHSSTEKKVLLHLFRDFLSTHTVTSLSKEFNISRVGVWKVLKKLESKKYISIAPIGSGKTSAFIARINWNSILVEKVLVLYLTEEALWQRRWRIDFFELEAEADFSILFGSILHSPQQASDIDLLSICKKNRFVRVQKIIDRIQRTLTKKIHSINFTEKELREELQRPNKVFLEAIRKGVVLFGQEGFVKFMRGVHTRWM